MIPTYKFLNNDVDSSAIDKIVAAKGTIYTLDQTHTQEELHLPMVVNDWRLHVIHTQGKNNVGTVVATPLGKRSSMIFKLSFIDKVKDLTLCTTEWAKKYYKVSYRVKYSKESSVIVHTFLYKDLEWEVFLNVKNPLKLAKELGYPTDISSFRFKSVLEILSKWNSQL